MALQDRFPSLKVLAQSQKAQQPTQAPVQPAGQKPLDQLTQADFDAMSARQRTETLARAGVLPPEGGVAPVQGQQVQPQTAQQPQQGELTGLEARFPSLRTAAVQQGIESPVTNELITSGDIPDLPSDEVIQPRAQQVDPVTGLPKQFPNVLRDFPPTRAVLDAQKAAEIGTGRGAIGLVGGAGQLAAGAGEALGLVEPGRSAAVTRGTQTLRESVAPESSIPQGFGAIAQGAESLTQAAPFMAVPFSQQAGPAIRQAGALGAIAGGSSFIENEEEAGLSLERGSRTVLSGSVGIVLPAAAAVVGKINQAIGRGDVPRQLTSRVEDTGTKTLTRKQALAAKESLDLGVPVTPGAAADSSVILAREGSAIPTPAKQFKAEAALKKGQKAAQSLADDFLDSVLPERGVDEPLRAQTKRLYEAAHLDNFDTGLMATRLKDARVQKTFGSLLRQFNKALENDPVKAAKLADKPPNSIARLDALKRFIDKQVNSFEKGDSFKKLGEDSVQEVRKILINTADDSSSAYSQARNLAHRTKVVENLNKRLAGKTVSDDAPIQDATDVSPIDFFRATLKNKKSVEALFKDLRDIKDPKIRSQAVRKARQLRRVLSRWEKTEPVLVNLTKGDPRTVQERSQVVQSAIFTAKRALERGKSDAMVDFLTSDRWADDVLAGAIRAKSPTQFAIELSNFINQIGLRSPGPGQDAAGTLGLEPPEQR